MFSPFLEVFKELGWRSANSLRKAEGEARVAWLAPVGHVAVLTVVMLHEGELLGKLCVRAVHSDKEGGSRLNKWGRLESALVMLLLLLLLLQLLLLLLLQLLLLLLLLL